MNLNELIFLLGKRNSEIGHPVLASMAVLRGYQLPTYSLTLCFAILSVKISFSIFLMFQDAF